MSEANKFNFFVSVYRSGRLGEACVIGANYIREHVKDERGYHLLAHIYNELGDFASAERVIKKGVKLVGMSIKGAILWDMYGQIKQHQGDLKQAEKHYKKASLCDKRSGLYHYHLGLLYSSFGRVDDSRKAYETSIQRDDSYAPAYNNLGLLALAEEDLKQAETCFEKAIERDKNYHQAWHNLSHVHLENSEQSHAAITCAEKALALVSDKCEYAMTLGKHYGALGQPKNAEKNYRKALTLDDGQLCGDIFYALATYTRGQEKGQEDGQENYEDDLKTIDNYLREIKDSQQLGQLNFAKAKIYEKLGDFERAEQTYIRANEYIHFRGGKAYLQFLKSFIDETELVFANIDLDIFDREGIELPQPIFIIGTMRCGSSLLEQILASHEKISGAGEVNHFTNALNTIVLDNKNIVETMVSKIIDSPRGEQLRQQISQIYWQRLCYPLRNEEHIYITDKQLNNFMHVGLIRLIMSGAKIIHCQRNSEDAALSIFCNSFTSDAHAYAYDLDEIAEFYKLYKRLTDFWHEKCPQTLYRLDYENLVSEPEECLKSLLDYLGLEWQDGLLDFVGSRRAVQTASSVQVRNSIYGGSVGKMTKFPNLQKRWRQLMGIDG